MIIINTISLISKNIYYVLLNNILENEKLYITYNSFNILTQYNG